MLKYGITYHKNTKIHFIHEITDLRKYGKATGINKIGEEIVVYGSL